MRSNKDTGKKRAKIFLSFLLLTLFSAVAAVMAWKIADYLRDERTSLEYWEGLQDSVVIMESAAPPTKEAEPTSTPDTQTDLEPTPTPDTQADPEPTGPVIPKSIDFDSLHAVSADAVAWLFAPDMSINYPVAQSEDNAYYLRRLLDGTYASGGSLFADYRCAPDFSDWNTVIYGHQMNDGTMFGELENYRDPAYYAEHPVMYLYIPGKRYTLELIAGYLTDVNDVAYALPTTKVLRDAILTRAAMRSTFDSGITPDWSDKLVTLSTCAYDYDDARYVLIGRIIEDMSN